MLFGLSTACELGACRSVDSFAQVGGQVIQPRFQGALVAALDGAAVSVFDTVTERVAFAAASDVVNVPAGERDISAHVNGVRVVEVAVLDLPGVINEARHL